MRKIGGLLVSASLLAGLIGATPAAVLATPPVQVSFTLEGCNLDHGGTFDENTLLCSDKAYTTGNMGKSWAELDYVPHRVTLDNNNGTQTFSFVVAGDYKNGAGTATGWDDITSLTLNTSLSDASCGNNNLQVGGVQITPSGGGVGGADQTIYRLVTVSMTAGEECVYDYAQRLAVGAHLFSGSSLQSNLWNENLASSGIGQKRIQLPVNEIEPQSISKTMSAVRGADFNWNLTKQANPVTLDFGDTCDPSTPLQKSVQISIQWTRSGPTPSGDVTITTNISVTNPAHRTITVAVEDKIYQGTTQSTLLDTASSGDVDVPPNQTMLVLTHSVTLPNSATQFNDVATATYKDTLTGVPVPGSTTANASATVQTSTTTNTTAGVTDAESITGTGLDFKVTGSTGASGTFDPALNVFTTSSDWVSGTQSGAGSVTINKTVRVTSATTTSGTLSDTATLTTSGSVVHNANASVSISSSTTVSIVIDKTIPNVLSGSETASFTFDVKTGGASGTIVDTKTINFTAGQTNKTATVSGLQAGTAYTVVEQAPGGGWNTPAPQTITINPTPGNLASCSATAEFENGFAPASARVKKVTDPVGEEAGWEFTLTGPGTPIGGEKVTTTGTGFVNFATVLQEGSYAITETGQTDWDNTASSAECSFTVNYPADADRVFSCTFTNVQRGTVELVKTFEGGAIPAGESFVFQLRQGASTDPVTGAGTTLATLTVDSTTTFPVQLNGSLVPGTYQICEFIKPGYDSTIRTMTGAFVPQSNQSPENVDNAYVCAPVTVTAGGTTTVEIDNSPPPGGMAKTIGFWKNWASCKASKGKQSPILDQTLVGHEFFVGTLYVDTCSEAVALLNKSRVDNGKKQASSPAFNFAAQYVAYKLNIASGADANAQALAAANAGQAILEAINFNGSTHLNISKATAALLNSYARTLDLYNNNAL